MYTFINKPKTRFVPIGNPEDHPKYDLNAFDWLAIGRWPDQESFRVDEQPIDIIIVFRVVYKKSYHLNKRFGGFVQSYGNLDQFGKSYLGREAIVIDDSIITNNGYVEGPIMLDGNSYVDNGKFSPPDSNKYLIKTDYRSDGKETSCYRKRFFYSYKDVNGVKLQITQQDLKRAIENADKKIELNPFQVQLRSILHKNVSSPSKEEKQVEVLKEEQASKSEEKKVEISEIRPKPTQKITPQPQYYDDDWRNAYSPSELRQIDLSEFSMGRGGATFEVTTRQKNLVPNSIGSRPRLFTIDVEDTIHVLNHHELAPTKKEEEVSMNDEVDLSKIDLNILKIFETVNNTVFDEQHKKYVLLRHPYFQRKLTLKDKKYGVIETMCYITLYKTGVIGGSIDDESCLSQDDNNMVLDSACLAFGSKLMGKGIVIGGNMRVLNSHITASDVSIRNKCHVKIIHSNIKIDYPELVTTGMQIVEANKASSRSGYRGLTTEEIVSGFSNCLVDKFTVRFGINYGLGGHDLRNLRPIPGLGKVDINLVNRINIYLKENGLGSDSLLLKNILPPIQIPTEQIELGKALSEGRGIPMISTNPKLPNRSQSKPQAASTTSPQLDIIQQPTQQQIDQHQFVPSTQQDDLSQITLDPDDSFYVSFDGENHLVQRILYADGSKGGYAESLSNIDGGIIMENGIAYGNVVIGRGTIISGNAIVCGTGRLTRPFEFTKNRIVMKGDNLYDVRKE